GDVKADVLKLAEGKGDAEAVAKKGELGDFMHLFKLRAKKGLGVGDKAGAITPDGIEAKLIAMTKKVEKTDVTKNAKANEKMPAITLAIGKVTDAHTPKKKEAGKDPKDWKKFVEEMKAGAGDLSTAVKDGDADKTKIAANKLVGACNECHTMFRD